jgi:hypothetical protein
MVNIIGGPGGGLVVHLSANIEKFRYAIIFYGGDNANANQNFQII